MQYRDRLLSAHWMRKPDLCTAEEQPTSKEREASFPHPTATYYSLRTRHLGVKKLISLAPFWILLHFQLSPMWWSYADFWRGPTCPGASWFYRTSYRNDLE